MRKLFSYIFSPIGWVLISMVTVFWASLSILSSLVSKDGKFQGFCQRRWGRWNCYSAGARVSIEGLEHVDRENPQAFAVNHQAMFDIMVLGGWLPVPFGWMVRKEWYKTPFVGWHLSRSANIAIDRSNPRASARSVIEAVRMIKAGRNVVFFPEGTRDPDGIMRQFKGGGFVLAQKANVPILPVTIDGAYKVLRKGSWLLNPSKVRIVISAPILPSNYEKNDRDSLMRDVEAAVAAHLPPESRVDFDARQAEKEN